MRASAAALALAAAAALLGAGTASGQPAWYGHYERGLEAEQQQRWQDAVGEFRAAAQLEKAPRRRVRVFGVGVVLDYDPYFHLARCLVEAGRPADAAVPLVVSFRAGVTPRPAIEELRGRITRELEDRQTRRPHAGAAELRVESEPPGAAVTVDGTAVGPTPLAPLPLAPGAHTLRLEAAGYEPESETVTLDPGPTTMRYSLRPLAVPTVTPASRPTQAPTPVPTARPAMVAPAAAPSVAAATPAPTAAASPAPSPTAGLVTPLEIPARAGGRFPWLPLLLLVVAAAAVALFLRRRPPAQAQEVTSATRVPADPTLPSATPTMIRDYRVLGMLGRGGMATTYRARRERDGALVALKVPHDFCLTDATFVTRFVREGHLGEQLHHPRIVRVLEAGEVDGRPFLAMELLSGRTLKEDLRANGAEPLRVVLERARDIAEALDYAHAKGVVHRDLKPENIMLLADGTLKVMDFGIARLTGVEGLTTASLFIGTPQYAAPEMIEPMTIDHRVDLYALGIVMFEMLEGSAPFSADSPYRVIEMHQHAPLPDRESLARPVPEAVWRIVTRLCAKKRDERYPTAEALLVELNRLLHDFSELEGGDGE